MPSGKWKASGSMLMLLLSGVLSFAVMVQPIRSESTTIYVPDDYERIQWAIGNATAGDTIFVRSGTYNESLIVTKRISLVGENPVDTIIDGQGMKIIQLQTNPAPDFTLIKGFTLRNGNYGIAYSGGSTGNNPPGYTIAHLEICGNIITDICKNGIALRGVNYATIHRNIISNSNESGLELMWAYGCDVYHNSFINNANNAGNFNDAGDNNWDMGYPWGGNYWDDHSSTDNYSGQDQDEPGSDGIADDPYTGITGDLSEDSYPLFSAGVWDVAVTDVTISPAQAYDGGTLDITVVAENQGNACYETFNVTVCYNTTEIDVQTVENLARGDSITLNFTWDTTDVPEGDYLIKAEADVVLLEQDANLVDNTFEVDNVGVHHTTRYMQHAKWDATYWKLLWNNTSTFALQIKSTLGLKPKGYLGVKVYRGTTCISGASVIQVGCWLVDQDVVKSTTWNCPEQNVTNTYLKVEIWYKFEGWTNWSSMGLPFKTETFTGNTVLNATTWTICLHGRLTQFTPAGDPKLYRTDIGFYWGSTGLPEESRIGNMIQVKP